MDVVRDEVNAFSPPPSASDSPSCSSYGTEGYAKLLRAVVMEWEKWDMDVGGGTTCEMVMVIKTCLCRWCESLLICFLHRPPII